MTGLEAESERQNITNRTFPNISALEEYETYQISLTNYRNVNERMEMDDRTAEQVERENQELVQALAEEEQGNRMMEEINTLLLPLSRLMQMSEWKLQQRKRRAKEMKQKR